MPKAPLPSATFPLDPAAVAALLDRYAIPRASEALATTADEAAALAAQLTFPVALKGVSSNVGHRSDVGAVRLDLRDRAGVRAAALELARSVDCAGGFIVQEMVAGGEEVFVGARRDRIFGPLVAVGVGGLWVEILEDVQLRLAPVSRAVAIEMLASLRAAPVLMGHRGRTAVDIESLGDVIKRVSECILAETSVATIDLNPVITGPTNVVVADAKVTTFALADEPGTHDDQLASDISELLNPTAVAVVGASRDRSKLGGRLIAHLTDYGYHGRIYPVGTHDEKIRGLDSNKAICDLPEVPDVACLIVPATSVGRALEECGRGGVKYAIIYSSGFAEAGEQGQQLERELLASARAYDIRVCGPNTAGIASSTSSFHASISTLFSGERPPKGGLAFISQSGAIASSLLSRTWAEGVGFSHWICTGNELDLTLADYLSFVADDSNTEVIVLYVEAVRDGEKFLKAARRAVENGKPILAYKAGASKAGRRAVESHTAALAGDYEVFATAALEVGIILVQDLEELVDLAVAFSWQPTPTGRRVGVITASGGAASIAADDCARARLELSLLPTDVVDSIEKVIPSFGSAENPIDVTAAINTRPEMVGEVAALVLRCEDVDSILVALTTNADPPAEAVAKGLVGEATNSHKPVIISRLGAEFLAPRALALYRAAQIPVYPTPQRAVGVLARMADYAGRVRSADGGQTREL